MASLIATLLVHHLLYDKTIGNGAGDISGSPSDMRTLVSSRRDRAAMRAARVTGQQVGEAAGMPIVYLLS